MKNKNYSRLILVFCVSLFMFACSSDDDNPPTSVDTEFTNKWWYDSNEFAADLYFNSNGEYEQFIDFGGFNNTATGNWSWEDESAGVLKITNLSGEGQVVSDVFLKLTDVEDTTMTVQQSTNGTDFSIEVFYQDTEPEE